MTSLASGRRTDRSRRPDLRSVGFFILLDLVTYGLLYWLVLPPFSEVLLAVGSETAMAIGWVLSAMRLGFLGLVVARAHRARRGLVDRSQIVPTMLTAAGAAFALQLVLGLVARVMLNEVAPASAFLLDLVLWLGFPLVALLFVTPGEPERLPLRFRAMADRGATNLLLIPAVAGLVAATLIVITVLGSATNDAREARAAADAAALAAAEAWRDRIELAFLAGYRADDADDFWDFVGTDLGSLSSWHVAEAADRFARANGAELLGVDVDPSRARVSVHVRHLERVPELGDRLESVATAELRFRGGVCRTGRTLGYLVGGTCQRVPPPTPTPTSEPDAAPPPPFESPVGIAAFSVTSVLTTER